MEAGPVKTQSPTKALRATSLFCQLVTNPTINSLVGIHLHFVSSVVITRQKDKWRRLLFYVEEQIYNKKNFFSIDNEISQECTRQLRDCTPNQVHQKSAQQTMTAWRETSLRLVSSITDLPFRVSDIEQIYANLNISFNDFSCLNHI